MNSNLLNRATTATPQIQPAPAQILGYLGRGLCPLISSSFPGICFHQMRDLHGVSISYDSSDRISFDLAGS